MRIAVLFTMRNDLAVHYHEDWVGRDVNDDSESVMKALKELGHEIKKYPVDLDLFEKLRADKDSIDLVFNLCDDGFFSDPKLEPHLPAMLNLLKLTYTGSHYLSLALCSNKARAKKILYYHDIPTPRFQVFNDVNEPLKQKLKFPLIVKPVQEDASVGVKDESVVKNEQEMRARVAECLKTYNQPALVEEFIDGREINVGIIGDKEPEVLPISEIKFTGLPDHKPKIINYSAKWVKDSVDYTCTNRHCPAEVTPELKKKLISLALRAGKRLLCRDYYRVDFRLDKDDNPYVLEVNPNPDISEDAGLAAMANVHGYSYKDLIEKIINSAAERKFETDIL
ncbi:MAG: ATP-grasp domain-containing protein [Candidatus Woesearchaeota archaeon]